MSIFDAVARRSGVAGFTQARIRAELASPVKTLDGIYRELASAGLNVNAESLKQLELQCELDQSFPITENVAKMLPSDIIISDMYLPREFLEKLLKKNGITKYSDILVSYDGKYSGRVWKELKAKPGLHTGDNYYADCETAQAAGIKASHYVDRPSFSEGLLHQSHRELANFVRVLRQQNPGGPHSSLWHEQATINVPVLVLASAHLLRKYGDRRYLFATREALNLRDIFTAMYPSADSHTYYTSRKCLTELDPEFVEYARHMFYNNAVVVDSHGSGTTSDYFYRAIGQRPDTFFIVGYAASKYPKYDALIKRKVGGWAEIEDMNQDVTGSVTSVKNGVPSFDEPKYDAKVVAIQKECVRVAADLIRRGFPLSIPTVDLSGVVRDLLHQLRKHKCAIHGHGIPHINDLPLTSERWEELERKLTDAKTPKAILVGW